MNNNAEDIKGTEQAPINFAAEHRAMIRREELELVYPFLKPGMAVLEIGAGAGWQAKVLAERGLNVTAIDIGASNYNNMRVFPVQVYDGVNIPLPNASVDVVFSSNVLEHVPHIESFQREIQRVLKDGGLSIHIMPSATWRLWTCISFYMKRFRQLISALLGGKKSNNNSRPPRVLQIEDYKGKPKSGFVNKLKAAAIPSIHGVRGNLITEFYYFSKKYWLDIFSSTGWKILKIQPNGLLYSGNRYFGQRLKLSSRRRLSALLGSSCIMYVLQK